MSYWRAARKPRQLLSSTAAQVNAAEEVQHSRTAGQHTTQRAAQQLSTAVQHSTADHSRAAQQTAAQQHSSTAAQHSTAEHSRAAPQQSSSTEQHSRRAAQLIALRPLQLQINSITIKPFTAEHLITNLRY